MHLALLIIIAVAIVVTVRQRRLTRQQQPVPSALAAFTAEHDRLLSVQRLSLKRAEQLQQLTAALAAASHLPDVVRIVIDAGLDALGADAGLVSLVDPRDGSLRLVEARGYDGPVPSWWHHIPANAAVPVAEAVRTGRTLLLRGHERDERFPSLINTLQQYAATLAMPLQAHGRVLGALAVNRRNEGDLSPEVIGFMEAFAQQCAHAIERVQRHEETRQLAAALEAERAKLTAVIDRLPVGVGISSPEGRTLFLNEAGLSMHGFASEQEMFEHLPQYVHDFELRYPDDRVIPVSDWPLCRATRGEYVQHFELRLCRRSTGEIRDVAYDVVPVYDANGAIAQIAYVMQDLTETKRAAAVLTERTAIAEQREAQLAAVLDRLPAAVWIANARGTLERVSAATEQLYGSAPLLASTTEYVEYEGYWPAGHARAGLRIESHEWALARSLATGESVLYEPLEIVRFGSGERRQVINASAAIRDASGAITGGVAVMFDVTDQVNTRVALERAEADANAERRRLRLVLDRLPVGVIVVDATGAIIHHNSALEPVLGHSVHPSSEVGDYAAYGGVRADGSDYAAADYPIARALLNGETVLQELTQYRRADGRIVTLSISAAPVFDDDGTLAYAVAAVEDVHERESARAAAEQANAAKSQFLTTMSHELRTPLHAIAGHVELVELGIHGPVTPGQQDALKRVQRAQRQLLSLINDILNFARLDAGRVEYAVEPVAVDSVVRDELPMVEPMFTTRGITLTVDLGDGEPVMAWADREKLSQVLLNLLSNAAKFTESGGTVHVALQRPSPTHPHQVRLQVHDTGVGIAPHKLEQVFEPFVQVDRGLTSKHEGTGLGLAISRTLARGMGGDLLAESTRGEGSVFTMMLRPTVTTAGQPLDRRTRDVPVPPSVARRATDQDVIDSST